MSVRRIYFLIVLLFVVILNIDIVAEFPPVRLYTSLWLIAVAHSGHTNVAGMGQLHGGSLRPKRTVSAIIGSKDSVTTAVQKARGEIVFDFIQTTLGEKVAGQIVQGGELVTLPKGFWPRCCNDCFHRLCTDAFRKALRKALLLHIEALRRGATTFAGKLGKAATQKRSRGRRIWNAPSSTAFSAKLAKTKTSLRSR